MVVSELWPSSLTRSARGRDATDLPLHQPLRLSCVGGKCVAVELDPEAGTGRQRDRAIDHLQLVAGEVLAQTCLAQLRWEELDVVAVGCDGGEMCRGCDRDTCLPQVRDNSQPALAGEVAHALGLGQAADTADVGLRDGDPPAFDQVEVLEARRQPLARRDRDRLLGEARVAVEVVRPQRRLNKEEVELLPVAQNAECTVGVGESVLYVDKQCGFRSDRAADRGQDLGTALPRLPQPVVRVGAFERDLRLDGLETGRDSSPRPVDH